jgi:hypothetical protein
MKHYYIVIFAVILLLAACVPEEIIEEEPTQPEEPVEETIIETPVATPEEIHYDEDEDVGAELEDGAEEVIEREQVKLTGDEQIQQIFNYADEKIKSYTYKYKNPYGKQYYIFVKENKIRISSISEDNKIYIDTAKKIAEEYCISHSKCGRETGKIADLDYYDAYIETPLDWLNKITEKEKVGVGSYYGRQSWVFDTNIGEVTMDSNFGFITKIKQEDKEYSFTESQFNNVKDSDVNIPEYLIEE